MLMSAEGSRHHHSLPDEGGALPEQAGLGADEGNVLERVVFNYRPIFIAACAVLTAVLGFLALHTVVNASFDRMIPNNHPYIKNYFENRGKMGGLGNVVRVVVENRSGDIFDPAFLEVTRKINDELFLLPGVDRAWMKSIWMSSVRWTEVTEQGFRGGAVMPANIEGFPPESLDKLRQNIRAAGIVGSLVGTDYRSVMFVLPLLEVNPNTGKRLDYSEFGRQLDVLRAKYGSDSPTSPVGIKIIGFAKLVGDLIAGLLQVMSYFAAAAVVSGLAIYGYTRCYRSTFLVIGCSLTAVVWLLGLTWLMGYEIDPYSMLVPFLVFAIGVSHGAQKMNGIMQDIGRGMDKYVAARATFRRLFLAGVTAIFADVVGFAVLLAIDIPAIKGLAVTASIGVGLLTFTNLLLLPVLLSYFGVSATAAARSLSKERLASSGQGAGRVWSLLDRFTTKRWAYGAIAASALLTAFGYMVSLDLKIGDLDPGAPELRQNSRYNQDTLFVNQHYTVSNDQFVVIAKTADQQCAGFSVLRKVEDLSFALRQIPGVLNSSSFADKIKAAVSGFQEGNPKWYSIVRSETALGSAAQWAVTDSPDLIDTGCSLIPVFAYLSDHKAETLERVVAAVTAFAQANDGNDVRFLLAAGPSGIEAVTNIIVGASMRTMLYWVYGAVVLLCMLTFRSWRATIVAVVPLMITSVLCEALMATLGIGVKVATLPVIALGVGIGVDYALYLLSVQLACQRAGMTVSEAYARAVIFTGKVVALVGITLATGVVTWVWSPIKFQADMGILLTFMFIWNMLGALILIPALSYVFLRSDGERRVSLAQ